MTAQGDDLVAFLEQAIAAHENAAQNADKEIGRIWGVDWDCASDEFRLVTGTGLTVAYGLTAGCSRHFELNAPETVLRRCAADRKLLKLHGDTGHSCPAYGYDGDLDDQTRFYDHETCPVIQHLAESYGWAEGER